MIFLFLFLTFLLQKHLKAVHYSLLVCNVDQLYIQGPCRCVTPGLQFGTPGFSNHDGDRPSFEALLESALSPGKRLGHTMLSAHLGKKCFISHTTNLRSLHFSPAMCQIKIFHFWLETVPFHDIPKSEAFISDGEAPGFKSPCVHRGCAGYN